MQKIFASIENYLEENEIPYRKTVGKSHKSIDVITSYEEQVLLILLEKAKETDSYTLRYYLNGKTGFIKSLEQFEVLL